MLREELNLHHPPEETLCGLGWTILVEAKGKDALNAITDAWKTVASFGRAGDTHLGLWPSSEKIELNLPDWLSRSHFDKQSINFDNWVHDLQHREWIWWNISELSDDVFKIDLKAFAMPISDWTIRVVIELSGATIRYHDLYVSNLDAKKYLEDKQTKK